MRASFFDNLFYPAKNLKETIEKFGEIKNPKADAVISPHAGYIYSGKIAAHSISLLKESKDYVILGPNHQGIGEISISTEDWETPLGIVKNSSKTKTILERLEIQEDNLAHYNEHSIEVQLPFLQYYFPNAKIIPISLNVHNKEKLNKLAKILAELNLPIIASSDFNHYLKPDICKEKDYLALEKIIQGKKDEFWALIEQGHTICGYQGIFTLMEYAKKRRLKAEIERYEQSPGEKVVGYVSVMFKSST